MYEGLANFAALTARMMNQQQAQQQSFQQSIFGSPALQFGQSTSHPWPNALMGQYSPICNNVTTDPVRPKPKKVRDYSEHLSSKDDKIIPLEDR